MADPIYDARLALTIAEQVRDERWRSVQDAGANAPAGTMQLLAQDEQRVVARRAELDALLAQRPPLFAAGDTTPIALLPVRIETVYEQETGPSDLLVRIYPDDVHVDGFDRTLTPVEHAAGRAYWIAAFAAGPNEDRRRTAWRALHRAVGGARAAWVAEAWLPPDPAPTDETPLGTDGQIPAWTAEPEVRDARASRPARTVVLPERFTITAYRAAGVLVRVDGEAVPADLPVGPDLAGTGRFPAWLDDFEAARQVGMGVRIPIEDPDVVIDYLTVVGVRAGGTEALASTLVAHRFASDLAIVPNGTPTNNLDQPSGWRSRSVTDDDPPAGRDVGEQAAALAGALGVDPGALAGVPDADAGADALFAMLLGVRLPGLLELFGPPEGPAPELPWLVDHARRFVRSRGPLPPIGIGRQPYGVLPVTSLALWAGEDVDRRLVDTVRAVLRCFRSASDRCPQVGRVDLDQDAVMVDLWSRVPVSRRLRPWPEEQRADGAPDDPAQVYGVTGRWLRRTVFSEHIVAPPWNAELDPTPELVAFAALHPVTVLMEVLVKVIEALLVDRHNPLPPAEGSEALSAAFNDVNKAFKALRESGEIGAFYTMLVDINGVGFILLALAVLSSTATDEQWEAAKPQLRAFVDNARELQAVEARAGTDLAALNRIACEVADVLSHRIDAWATSVATARLSGLRVAGVSGVHVGAYGWVTEVVRRPWDPSDGYVVAPSMHHATTAAVLRSGRLAHQDSTAFATKLTSRPTRRAMAVIEGVRNGQELTAMLGYQFERGLHDRDLDRLLAAFRRHWPLVVAMDDDPTDAGRRSERLVVDGDRLRRDGLAAVIAAGIVAPGDAAAEQVAALVTGLDETVDALGDVVLAEATHHLVGGNPLRAGLAVDTLGRAEALPRELDVLRTPRRARVVRQRVGIVVPERSSAAGAGPRATVEPGLEAWCALLLGELGRGQLSAVVTDEAGAAVEVDTTLAELGLGALDAVCDPVGLRDAVGARGGGTVTSPGPALRRLELLTGALRSVLARSTPPLEGADLAELHVRLSNVVPDVPPPVAVTDGQAARAWFDAAATAARRVLGPAMPLTVRVDTSAAAPAAEAAVEDWLEELSAVRPVVRSLADALLAASSLADAAAAGWQRDAETMWHAPLGAAAPGTALLVDEWNESIPLPPGDSGHAEEIAALAVHVNRSDARPPQAILIAVPPDPAAGWRADDLHAILDETLELAAVRGLDLDDVPELRSLLPAVSDGGT